MIRSLNRVSPSEYLLPIVSAWVDMAYSDMAQRDVLSFGPEDRLLVYVNKGGELRSALVWCYYADDASARVLLGYTWPPYRSRGLYTALYARMRKEAKKLGANKTLGGIMVGNTAMLELAEKQGRKATAIWVEEFL